MLTSLSHMLTQDLCHYAQLVNKVKEMHGEKKKVRLLLRQVWACWDSKR